MDVLADESWKKFVFGKSVLLKTVKTLRPLKKHNHGQKNIWEKLLISCKIGLYGESLIPSF